MGFITKKGDDVPQRFRTSPHLLDHVQDHPQSLKCFVGQKAKVSRVPPIVRRRRRRFARAAGVAELVRRERWVPRPVRVRAYRFWHRAGGFPFLGQGFPFRLEQGGRVPRAFITIDEHLSGPP